METATSNENENSEEFECPVCQKKYQSKRSMRGHYRLKHPDEFSKEPEKPRYLYNCDQCDYSASSRHALCIHLENIHNLDCTTKTCVFDNEEKFHEWMDCLLRTEAVQYTRTHVTDGQNANSTREVYTCSRTKGNTTTKSKGVRLSRSKPSIKSEIKCISNIISVQDLKTGKCHVEYQSRHIGHDKDFHLVRMSKYAKNQIKTYLKEGNTISQIIKLMNENPSTLSIDFTTENNLPSKHKSRDQTITRQDVFNCMRELQKDGYLIDNESLELYQELRQLFARLPTQRSLRSKAKTMIRKTFKNVERLAENPSIGNELMPSSVSNNNHNTPILSSEDFFALEESNNEEEMENKKRRRFLNTQHV